MSENTPIQRSSGIDLAGGAQSAKRAPAAATPATGAAFKALIEKLEAQARELQSQAQGVRSAEDLAGAVDRARDSLDGALSLGESLIEAYREALHRPEEPSRVQSGDAATESPRQRER